MTVAQFCREHNLGRRFEKNLSKGKEGWRYPDTYNKIISNAADARYKDCKYVTNGLKYSKSPFNVMEVELYKCVKEHRSKSRKVSKSFIKIKAKILLKELQPKKAATFCASDCWLQRFCKRKKIKFRKRKSGEKRVVKII